LGSHEEQSKIIGPASTLKLVTKDCDTIPLPDTDPGAIPKGRHWADLTDAGTVVVIEQPEGQVCAAIGGIMALRMKVKGVVGCVVGGRVRDLAELKSCGLPVGFPETNFASRSRKGIYRPSFVRLLLDKFFFLRA
jgi:regulator of RNase E activity RraA